jgi:endonuclease G
VGYDASAKLPRYVTYTLLPQNALGCVARTNAFVKDETTPNGASPQDYAGTGYDKGHMSPDGDQSWDVQVEYESFLMTNMSPQAGSLNRGIWKLLETSVRGWAVQRNQSYTIYVGGLYNATDKKIGNGVVVPHGFYKIVINNQTNEVAGWIFPHNDPYPNLGNDLTKFRVGVAQIQGMAGVNFAFPQNAKELTPGQEWPVNFGALTNAKRAKCGSNASND